jgi:hypothetical protein
MPTKKLSPPTICCSACSGTGRVQVTGVYLETLHQLRHRCADGGYVIAHRDAGNYFDCAATALNNRLAWLEKHGFARSEKYGKQRRFFPV